MKRISDGRIARMEQKVSLKLAEQSAKRKETIKQQQIAAEYHSMNVAAIIKVGNPRCDEPLNYAWERTLKLFEIKVTDPFSLRGQQAAAWRLQQAMLDAKDPKSHFTELFAPAPGWLLRFTRICFDSFLLDYRLPLPWGKEKWGIIGFDISRRWPALPLTTMGAGDPIAENDYTRQYEWAVLEAGLIGRTKAKQRHAPSWKKLVISAIPDPFAS